MDARHVSDTWKCGSLLNLLEPQSRFGDKWTLIPNNLPKKWNAVLKVTFTHPPEDKKREKEMVYLVRYLVPGIP